MHNKVFEAYSRYYDLLYRDKDYIGEVDYIYSLLSKHGIHQGSVLEFGSGTGKHGRLLSERGYLVHGIERSPEMVSQAEQTNGFACQVGDICTIKMGKIYDVVLSLFHVISYQISAENLNAAFAKAAEHLDIGGLFIFDFWYSPAVYSQRPNVRVKRMEDTNVEITRIAEPVIYANENRVDVNYTIFASYVRTGEVQKIQETHSIRHFSLPEINLLASLHGFNCIEAEEFLSGNTPGEATWGVCVILKKVKT